MDITATLDTDVDADTLYAVVADLGGYPQWLDIVGRAAEVASDPTGGDAGPAWSVDLRGQVGPLRRSKRLRMVRTVAEPSRAVRFERRELDDRRHAAWILEGTVAERPGGGSGLTMRLHYGGSLWVPLLDRVLRDEIERSRPRLVAVARAAV